MKQKKLAAITLVAATAVLGSGVSVYALPAVTSTDYTITIPATLEVANAGWNATDGITAQVKSGDTFDSGKKLTVTASSDDEFALVSGENKVGYNLATATGTYSATAEVPVWEFSADDLNADGGKTNPMGIIVEDYSDKPAGTYQDTVTFTAKVESAKPEYYDKLVECGVDDLSGKCVNGGSETFTGQTITAAQAIALAQAKATETGSNCAVFYAAGENPGQIQVAMNNGTTKTTQYYYYAEHKGLTGYKGYYVSK